MESLANVNGNIHHNEVKKSNEIENKVEISENIYNSKCPQINVPPNIVSSKTINNPNNNINSNYSSYDANNHSTQAKSTIKEGSVDNRLSKFDIKSNMKRRSSVQSRQNNANNQNEDKQVRNNITTINNSTKPNNNNVNNTRVNDYSTNSNDMLANSILNKNENKRLSELQNNYSNINNKNILIGNNNLNTYASKGESGLKSNPNANANNENSKNEGGLMNKISNLFSKKK